MPPSQLSPSTLEAIKSAKGVLFDIDGTLADSWKLGFDATQVVLEKNQYPSIDEECYHAHCIYTTPNRLARHAGLVPGDSDFESLGERLGAEFDSHYVELVSTQTAGFYNGVQSLLDNIPADVSVGALTNACVAYADAVLRVNDNVITRFSSVRGADNVPAPKPNADGLVTCCKDMGVNPEDCVYIGDSPSDGMAAQAAGMLSLGVLWGSHTESSLSNAPFVHLCSTVEELQSMLPQKS